MPTSLNKILNLFATLHKSNDGSKYTKNGDTKDIFENILKS